MAVLSGRGDKVREFLTSLCASAYISQRTTKNNIKEYRNKYDLTQEKLVKPSLLRLPGTGQITLAIVYLYLDKSCP